MSEELAINGGSPVRTEPFPSWPIFGKEEQTALSRVLNSGQWGRLSGDEVAKFERRFADYHHAAHGIAVVNGTVSLRIALLAAGIEAGDEVIVPPYTFLATATAVVEANATPVFVDIDLETFNIDPKAIEAAITDRTKAIIPVHVGGLPADMDAIMDIANRHGLTVIEDSAHAHGAEYKGRRVGSLGHMGSFSFQSSKNFTSGEGGIVITSDDDLAGECRSIHNCGRAEDGQWYEHHIISGNYRLGEFQGAILNAQFDRFDEQAARRDRNAKYLVERLSKLSGIYLQKRGDDCTRHGCHLFLFRLNPAELGVSREVFLAAIEAEGIPACAGYVLPLYRQPVFTNLAFGPYTGYKNNHPDLDYTRTNCPNCETICTEQGAWMYQSLLLGEQKDMDDIIRAFEKVHANLDSLAEPAEKTVGATA
ncbi:MAG: DegT/DnrJ/EryC1/StrS family aminotransferase [Phycisphaerae bacterium]|nr:DegT/DnrJ/EryC1/StrS family aminotransferase [Phycisphaerae bacterium]